MGGMVCANALAGKSQSVVARSDTSAVFVQVAASLAATRRDNGGRQGRRWEIPLGNNRHRCPCIDIRENTGTRTDESERLKTANSTFTPASSIGKVTVVSWVGTSVPRFSTSDIRFTDERPAQRDGASLTSWATATGPFTRTARRPRRTDSVAHESFAADAIAVAIAVSELADAQATGRAAPRCPASPMGQAARCRPARRERSAARRRRCTCIARRRQNTTTTAKG